MLSFRTALAVVAAAAELPPVAVPESISIALLGSALLGLELVRRRNP